VIFEKHTLSHNAVKQRVSMKSTPLPAAQSAQKDRRQIFSLNAVNNSIGEVRMINRC
jgi:hypothetical protein